MRIPTILILVIACSLMLSGLGESSEEGGGAGAGAGAGGSSDLCSCSEGASIVHPQDGHVVVVDGGTRKGHVTVEVRVSSRNFDAPSPPHLPAPSSPALGSSRHRSGCYGQLHIYADEVEVGQVCVGGKEEGGREELDALMREKEKTLDAGR